LSMGLSEISTSFVIAPLMLGLHCASPDFARCVNVTPKTVFPGLAIQHQYLI
jgi:hypothetical protein